MKKLFLFMVILSISFTQNDEAEVKAILYDYIDGTANGEVSRLHNAFEENSALYTIGKDQELVRRPSKQYIGFFKEGRKNNRKGQITYVDIVNNAATAIVEVVMGDRTFTDYILLLKIESKWKIINKSYTFVHKTYKGKVLFIVSNFSTYGDNKRRTGSHYGELVSLYDEFIQKGYEVDFVSPTGGAIPVSYINLQDDLQKKYFYDTKLNYKLKTTSTPNEIKSQNYEAILYVGGSAIMFDVPDNKEIISLTKRIYEKQNGVIGAVCHGVAGLVNIKLESGKYLVDGQTVNSFTNKEENSGSAAELLPFLIETKLIERGAIYKSSDNWQEHVEVSNRIVTGQNPASTKKLVQKMIEEIEAKN